MSKKGIKPKNLEYLHSLPYNKERYKKMVATRMARGGYKHTAETKIKCGLINKGKKLTEEHKKKIAKNNVRYWLGKKRPHMSGEKNWNYGKYGSEHTRYVENKKTSLRKAARNSKKYHDYKRQILERDNFACVLCGNKKAYLELDHFPVSFAELFRQNDITSIDQALSCEKLWERNNGRTICQGCHEKTDTFPKQLIGTRTKILYR